MVVQPESPEFDELNPWASKVFDSLGSSANLIYIYWTLKVVVILSLFEWYKSNITKEQQIIGLYLFILTSFFLTGFDYFNDFSYWIGVKNG